MLRNICNIPKDIHMGSFCFDFMCLCHRFALICNLLAHYLKDYSAGTAEPVWWLPQRQWSNLNWYGYVNWYLIIARHNKARALCIFHGMFPIRQVCVQSNTCWKYTFLTESNLNHQHTGVNYTEHVLMTSIYESGDTESRCENFTPVTLDIRIGD